jgi:hypothetical protein
VGRAGELQARRPLCTGGVADVTARAHKGSSSSTLSVGMSKRKVEEGLTSGAHRVERGRGKRVGGRWACRRRGWEQTCGRETWGGRGPSRGDGGSRPQLAFGLGREETSDWLRPRVERERG